MVRLKPIIEIIFKLLTQYTQLTAHNRRWIEYYIKCITYLTELRCVVYILVSLCLSCSYIHVHDFVHNPYFGEIIQPLFFVTYCILPFSPFYETFSTSPYWYIGQRLGYWLHTYFGLLSPSCFVPCLCLHSCSSAVSVYGYSLHDSNG